MRLAVEDAILPVSAVTLIGAAIAWFVYDAIANAENPIRHLWSHYEHRLHEQLEFLLSTTKASTIAQVQVVVVICWSAFAAASGILYLFVFAPFLMLGPWVVLRRQRSDRITRLETQLDGWLVTLANALKASPSLSDAIQSTASLMHTPISQELDLLVKQQNLGTPLDEALHNMGERIGSKAISTALVTLLIARQSGGDVPATLENSAATLREMARLEGVIRTKTAEGKTQAYVLAVVPMFLLGSIYRINPTLLQPLFDNFLGHILVALAMGLWLAAIPVALKILAVDI